MSLHDKIAKEISGKEPYLKCDNCGKKIVLSAGDVSNRLKNGWEKCCGYTMRYYPNRIG
jgi:hypothetical protein